MQAGISMMVLILMSLNLSPQGPPELRAGSFWSYRIDQGETNVTMRIVEASPSDAGTALKVAVSVGDEVSLAIRVVVAPDRTAIRAWMDARSGETAPLDIVMPELKVGSQWQFPEEGTVTIRDVQPQPTTTPAGSFPNAVKVSAAPAGESPATVWIAPGVGLLGAGQRGEREIELVDYGPRAAMVQMPGAGPVVPVGTSVMPVPPSLAAGACAPVVTVLDRDTFIVTDPATRTVTVFLLERPKRGEWRLVSMAAAPYGAQEP